MKYKKLNFETWPLPFRFTFENGIEFTFRFTDFDTAFQHVKAILRGAHKYWATDNTIIINDHHKVSINIDGDITLSSC